MAKKPTYEELEEKVKELEKKVYKRKLAEEALRESENRFRRLTELLPEVVYETDTEGNFTFVNRVALETFGYTREDIETGLNAIQVFAPEHQKRAKENIRRVLSGEKLGTVEYMAQRKDATIFPVIIHSAPTVDAEGSIVGLRGIALDISERKKTEEALKESEARYKQLVENANDLVYWADAGGHISFFNPLTEKITGFSREVLIGKHYLEFIRPDYRKKAERFYGLQLLKKTANTYYEVPVITKDGKEIWLGQNVQLLRQDDKVVGFQAVARDITERMRAEETLRDSEAHIRGLNEQILNMLAVVSHDIRSPLFSVASTLKLLKMGVFGKMDEKAKNTASDLHARINKLIGTAEDVLGKASVVKHDLDIERAVLNLREDIVNPILEELFPEIEDQNITVDNRLGAISASEIPIKADKIWLKIVFRNLFRNAIKYGGKGCTIAFGFADCGSHYKFNVYNNGEPIPEGFRDKVFTKFYRIGDRGKETFEGMGLGLYLTREIIQKHGGDIWYEAKEGGSNFVFTLPHD